MAEDGWPNVAANYRLARIEDIVTRAIPSFRSEGN